MRESEAKCNLFFAVGYFGGAGLFLLSDATAPALGGSGAEVDRAFPFGGSEIVATPMIRATMR